MDAGRNSDNNLTVKNDVTGFHQSIHEIGFTMRN